MDSLWCKYKKLSIKKKQALHSIFAGFAYFTVLYIITLTIKGSLCPINRLFGISCFGCGMTRAFASILKMDFLTAVKYNVLSIPLFIFILLYCVLAIIDFLLEKSFIEIIEIQLSKKYMFIIYAILLVGSYIINSMI